MNILNGLENSSITWSKIIVAVLKKKKDLVCAVKVRVKKKKDLKYTDI